MDGVDEWMNEGMGVSRWVEGWVGGWVGGKTDLSPSNPRHSFPYSLLYVTHTGGARHA